MFDYRLGLHYSQTQHTSRARVTGFDYRLGLHYSQTERVVLELIDAFDYRLGLHYSQTSNLKTIAIVESIFATTKRVQPKRH